MWTRSSGRSDQPRWPFYAIEQHSYIVRFKFFVFWRRGQRRRGNTKGAERGKAKEKGGGGGKRERKKTDQNEGDERVFMARWDYPQMVHTNMHNQTYKNGRPRKLTGRTSPSLSTFWLPFLYSAVESITSGGRGLESHYGIELTDQAHVGVGQAKGVQSSRCPRTKPVLV